MERYFSKLCTVYSVMLTKSFLNLESLIPFLTTLIQRLVHRGAEVLNARACGRGSFKHCVLTSRGRAGTLIYSEC